MFLCTRIEYPNIYRTSDYPSQCYDGKKAFNVGKYYPQTHRVCKQMICREDFTLLLEEWVKSVKGSMDHLVTIYSAHCIYWFVFFYSWICSCGVVEVPDGYKNVPDKTKRFPDCCVNIIKIENGTKTDANQTTVETSPIKIDVINPITIDGNATKFENATKVEENVINDNLKKLR